MAKYSAVNGVYRKVEKKYAPVDGVYRNVKAAFEPVNGVYRQYFSNGIPASELAVGDSVWLNVNGVQKEFLVVHQGNPDSTIYPSSCKGTWLLMKDLYTKRVWGTSGANYSTSGVHTYLKGTFLKLLDSGVQAKIKTARIPYVYYTYFYDERADEEYYTANYKTGSNGLSTKVFLLSGYEVGATVGEYNYSFLPKDGACLDYFNGTSHNAADPKRVANYNGTANSWWLRTPLEESDQFVHYLDQYGKVRNNTTPSATSMGVRPAFILDSSTIVNQSAGKNIIA